MNFFLKNGELIRGKNLVKNNQEISILIKKNNTVDINPGFDKSSSEWIVTFSLILSVFICCEFWSFINNLISKSMGEFISEGHLF